MKKFKFIALTTISFFCVSLMSAQTAEDVINNYINALGSKDSIGQITSVYTEGTMVAMGSQGSLKTTMLNGKGFKYEVDVAGTVVIMCYTDSMGWQINPMSGNYNADIMPESQYKAGRDQIFIGGFFNTDYLSRGYKIELAGQENVGSVNAYKINVASPENIESNFYFDPETWYLIKMIQKVEMMGQFMDVTFNFSNYQKPENGYVMPFTTETNYGGQFFLTAIVNKVEINQPVDPAVFAKP